MSCVDAELCRPFAHAGEHCLYVQRRADVKIRVFLENLQRKLVTMDGIR
jgi:hypothetical protein